MFFVTQNISTRDDLTGLLSLFKRGGTAPLIAIDHEGGSVQRLREIHGCTRLPAARTMAARFSPQAALERYHAAGKEVAALGFNLVLGPVLDLDSPENRAIGRLKRSYSDDPERIAAYGLSYCWVLHVQAFSAQSSISPDTADPPTTATGALPMYRTVGRQPTWRPSERSSRPPTRLRS